MWKKILTFALVALILTSIAACKEKEEKKPVSDPSEIDVSDGKFFGNADADTTASTETDAK